MEMATTQQPTWMSYEPTKDCTLGLCSMYCPQWCYIIFPPPPSLEFDEESSGTTLSPLVIAIIGILASAFLIVSYYTLVSKYCNSFSSIGGRQQSSSAPRNQQLSETENHHEEWPMSAPPDGLDEILINKVSTVYKYRKGSGFVDASDCSVCLSEFKNDEAVRLLPKCRHAFHVQCIDTWLKSHSNCPLCRDNIAPVNSVTIPVTENICPVEQQAEHSNDSELSNSVQQLHGSADTVVEIRDDHDDIEPIRPSLALDSSPCARVLIADVLQISTEDEAAKESDIWVSSSASSSSSRRSEEQIKDCSKNRGLHCIVKASSVANARSGLIKHSR